MGGGLLFKYNNIAHLSACYRVYKMYYIKEVIQININNLKEGQTIKNYKELCNILEVKISNGNSKIKQIKEMDHYFKYRKEGNKYIIEEIYINPTISINELKQGKYIKQLSNIILEYLYNSNELDQVPLFKLLNILGVTNINYENVNKYRKEYSQIAEIHLASIYYFYSNTKMEFKRIIESCLNNLKKRRILNWNTCVMIIDNNTNKIYKGDKETEKLIIDTEYIALKELNKSNMFELMKDKKALKQFNELVRLETGGLNYYYAYDLTVGNIALKCEYETIQKEKEELNNLIIGKLDNTFNSNRFINFKADYDILIDSLINLNNNNDLLPLLEQKREENKNKYGKLKNEMNNYIDEYANKDNDNNNIIW